MAHAALGQDGRQRRGFWEVEGPVASPFDLSRTLPVDGGFLVPSFLPGLPVLKQLTADAYYAAWPGRAVSVRVPLLTLSRGPWMVGELKPQTFIFPLLEAGV